VCRVYQSQQIRIEPVWERREALGVSRDNDAAIRQTTNNFGRGHIGHELDCDCADCVRI